MGGSGGYGFGSTGNIPYKPAGLDQALDRTRQQAAEASTAQIFTDALKDINQQDTEALNRHKEVVLKTLQDAFPDAVDLHGGGSYTRHTYVDGLSDIDVLLDLGTYSSSTLPNKDDPHAVLAEMERQLKQRFPKTTITAGRMAVTLQFSDGQELQVLPAFSYHTGYRIPDPQGNGWTVTRPHIFGQLLRSRNAEVGENLLPVIKLAKRICDNQGVEVKSYHLENMAVRAFEGYSGAQTYEPMLHHLFNQAKALAASPMKDITGQDTYVDGYLSTGAARATLARQLADVEQQIAGAEGDSVAWQRLLRPSGE